MMKMNGKIPKAFLMNLVAAVPLVGAARSLAAGEAVVGVPAFRAGMQLAASQPAAKTAHSSEVMRLLAAAREKGEREINLIWSEESFGGHRGAKMFEETFNRMYGTNIRVNFTPGPSMPDVAGRVTQEVAAGQKSSTDVLLGTESHFGSLMPREVLEVYDYSRLSPRIPKELTVPIGVEIATFFAGVTYNRNLVPRAEAPGKLEDVLNPKWKGKIASTPYAAQFDRIALLPQWGPERMKAFLVKFSTQVGGLIRCGETSRIATGEFIMMAMDCGSYYVRLEQSRGAPLEHVILEDGTTISFFYWGVPRNAAHPNLAKLFINMAMSEEGQKVVYRAYFTDHYALPGSQTAAELSGLRAKGIEPLKIGAPFVAKHPELRQLSMEFADILRGKR